MDLTTIMTISVFHFEKEETSFVFGIHYFSGKWKIIGNNNNNNTDSI